MLASFNIIHFISYRRGLVVSKHSNAKKYSEIKDTLNTGDIVLFCGVDIIGWGIKMYTTSQYSHIGMVRRTNTFSLITSKKSMIILAVIACSLILYTCTVFESWL